MGDGNWRGPTEFERERGVESSEYGLCLLMNRMKKTRGQ